MSSWPLNFQFLAGYVSAMAGIAAIILHTDLARAKYIKKAAFLAATGGCGMYFTICFQYAVAESKLAVACVWDAFSRLAHTVPVLVSSLRMST